MVSNSFFNRAANLRGTRGTFATTHRPSAVGVVDCLREHDQFGTLWAAVNRTMALQKDCQAALPSLFGICSVLQLTSERLVVSTPNAAMATKLKQQLPTLQNYLCRKGWQVNAIQVKVQVGSIFEQKIPVEKPVLSDRALASLQVLERSLEWSVRNEPLKKALHTMLTRGRSK